MSKTNYTGVNTYNLVIYIYFTLETLEHNTSIKQQVIGFTERGLL